MLEYKVQASTLTVFCRVEHPSKEEDTIAWQSPMVTVTWSCLLRQRPWFYFHVTYQLSQLRHGFSYDCSMLEYEVQASILTVFCRVKHPSEEEDTSAWQSPMVTVTQFWLLRRQPWTFESTADATVEWQWSNIFSILNCLYPLWAWHEIHFLSVFNSDFGQL